MGDTRPSVALEAIFRRLPQRSLAACRCVCRKWLTIIDARRLLRRDLLPFSMGGIFITLGFSAQAPPAFFARPSSSSSSSSSAIAAGRDLDSYALETNSPGLVRILDCCNGLLLLRNRVVNPATWQWARVPPPRHVAWADNGGYGAIGDAYLVYDPSTSPDSFEVVLIQDASFLEDELEDGSEWPPPSYTMSIYSSAAATAAGARQGRWEERTFVRDGEPAGTFGVARLAQEPKARHGVYWHGALYVHCTGYFIIRLTFSDNKYKVIKLPAGADVGTTTVYKQHLAKSRDGVYFALVRDGFNLQVWFLNEVNGQTDWLFKYLDLRAMNAHFRADHKHPVDRPWILQHGEYRRNKAAGNNNAGEVARGWDSDSDNVVDIEHCGCEKGCGGPASVFGFHPFKEVALLYISGGRVVVFHLESSKIQDLGPLSLGYCGNNVIEATFVYTPCRIGQLSDHKKFRCMCGM